MRGQLSEERLEEINDKLPVLDRRLHLATFQGPGVDINDLINEENIGVAIVCLSDAGHRFAATRLALHEAYACLIWYREDSPNAPREMTSVFLSKFYVDYATLFLYAIGEDIAAFIISFLGIESVIIDYLERPEVKQELSDKKISSNAGKVGLFMRDEYPGDEITQVILELHRNEHWRKSLKYRNIWVHEKPPIIEGLGIQYNRQSRVNGNLITFGGGSDPEYAIDELLESVLQASYATANSLSRLTDILIEKRQDLGEIFDFDNGRVSTEIF
ncbi:MAG: hypothetical protein KDJ65_34275 [Anaerolineae bacterium]|nr:hypothetical protein [Anaerolineae bacterium]